MNKKFMAIPAFALAAGLSLAACGSSGSPTGSASHSYGKTLISVRQDPGVSPYGGGSAVTYLNHWSGGSYTSCVVATVTNPSGPPFATGDCAPEHLKDGNQPTNQP